MNDIGPELMVMVERMGNRLILATETVASKYLGFFIGEDVTDKIPSDFFACIPACKVTVGDIITMREKLGMSQEEFSKHIGIPLETLRRLEDPEEDF